jgi:hypothetical protein
VRYFNNFLSEYLQYLYIVAWTNECNSQILKDLRSEGKVNLATQWESKMKLYMTDRDMTHLTGNSKDVDSDGADLEALQRAESEGSDDDD